jgi:hypothetical protein
MVLQEVGWGIDWIDLVQGSDRRRIDLVQGSDRRRILVNVVMNLPFA